MRIDYDETLHGVYGPGRRLDSATMLRWMKTISPFLDASSNLRILDIGAGTGRFAVPLANFFDAWVLALDPSVRMLLQIPVDLDRGGISTVVARAEELPLRSASFDAIFCSMALHHFPSLERVASAIANVLRPGGSVLVRNSFRGRLESICYHRFFPGAKALDDARLPSVEETALGFEKAGLGLYAHIVVRQEIDVTLASHLERIRLRTISTLQMLPDEEFSAGIRRMEEEVRGTPSHGPILEDIDLLVFRKN